MLNKFLVLIIILVTVVGCSNAGNSNQDTAQNLQMVDTNANKKPLEELIVFDQNGVKIRRDGNNLILVMEQKILFDFDKFVIKKEVKPVLDTLSTALVSNPDMKIKIDGFTDSKGTDIYNLELSYKRSLAIKNYLISREVPENIISVEGMGELNPVGNNSTDAGRQENRRVEFIISRDF
ncbi:MAG: OmpA family protein [Fusobacteriaceae bacterium]